MKTVFCIRGDGRCVSLVHRQHQRLATGLVRGTQRAGDQQSAIAAPLLRRMHIELVELHLAPLAHRKIRRIADDPAGNMQLVPQHTARELVADQRRHITLGQHVFNLRSRNNIVVMRTPDLRRQLSNGLGISGGHALYLHGGLSCRAGLRQLKVHTGSPHLRGAS